MRYSCELSNRSIVSLDSVRHIKCDMQHVAGLLLDLDKRMRVFMGEYSLDKLKEPLTEPFYHQS